MGEIELEYTFLAKYFPEDLFDTVPNRIIDLYLPKDARNPNLRIRAKGDNYTINKKTIIDGDISHQIEQNLELTPEEFDAISFYVEGKMLVKDRYEYPIDDTIYEFDVFREDLLGLVLIDVEFGSIAERDSFDMPDFCLVDVTYDEWVDGGMLAGKTLDEVRDYYKAYDYQPLL